MFQFCEIYGYKIGKTTNLCFSLLFFVVVVSGIRDKHLGSVTLLLAFGTAVTSCEAQTTTSVKNHLVREPRKVIFKVSYLFI
jgi:hypothetical protein